MMNRFLLRSTRASLPMAVSRHLRWLSTQSVKDSFQKVSILYGSQTGTAQLFAMQLQQALQCAGKECTMKAMAEVPPSSLTDDCLHLFLISTTGVGEFPSNAKSFYDGLSSSQNEAAAIPYAIFALGNSQAHPNHFCAAGKALQQAFQTKFPSAVQVLPLRLGDDAVCIDDEFDQWQEKILRTIAKGTESTDDETPTSETSTPETETNVPTSRIPTNYPELHLLATQQSHDDTPDLLGIFPSFYKENCRQRMEVTYNRNMHPHAVVDTGLHEMRLSLPSDLSYETGDHIMIYPRNPDLLVQAYLSYVLEDGVDPSQVVNEASQAGHYPHPSGISVYQTLSHCVDLTAPPSPSFARWLTSSKSLEYRQQISQPRRTVLDLVMENSQVEKVSLADLLYQLPPLQPRYYSIASAASVHPYEVYLTYRPVHYISSRGSLRDGLCTTFLQNCKPPQTVVAGLVSNPAFRLPSDPQVPVIFIGGGCGVAPIRGFLEELVHQGTSRPKNVSLYLGFRDRADQVYHQLVEESQGFLQECHIGYASVGSLVTKALARNAESLHQQLVSQGAHVFICGGAASFGAAIRKTVTDLLWQGNCSGTIPDAEAATTFLQNMSSEGRWHEDLSD
ncbi:hypothetical protein FisN_20Hh172 [Fistulifera solaris]|uniref:NADPH--hemoprotein reductase n=1 Tax=Fistulifera solaris TaxID=1519565 RepID=A0A1Z5JJL7_FISSO|nr:hypothetical protein FisN_20Hh172 [Fistulifera solaris]|eukprot:GAX14205.1 hypothetical protein FisN_20Hh172 [Fistulifera solaris]